MLSAKVREAEGVGFMKVEVASIVIAGIIVDFSENKEEIVQILIPWHRVEQVRSDVDGEIFIEAGR